jgi:hypothetical protein
MDGVVRTKPDLEVDLGSQTLAWFDAILHLYFIERPMIGHVNSFRASWLGKDTLQMKFSGQFKKPVFVFYICIHSVITSQRAARESSLSFRQLVTFVL